MRAKSDKRLLAEKYRKEQGLSYKEISLLLGISKSTLSGWLKDISLTEEQKEMLIKHMEANRVSFSQRAWLVNRNRYENYRHQARNAGVKVLDELPNQRSVDELSIAMLYLGEGSKSYGRVQIASTQAVILSYFLTMLRRLYHIDETRLRLRLNLISSAFSLEDSIIIWWKTELKYVNARFQKTQYDHRSRAVNISDGYHGVCTITYCDTYLQQRLISIANSYILSCISK